MSHGPGSRALIVFTRHPVPGRAKTRLIPLLGPEGAADLQRRMGAHLMIQARQLAAEIRVDVEVCYQGEGPDPMRNWLGPDLTYTTQTDGDLGRRMEGALNRSFDRGARATVLVGTDCPGLDAGLIALAFEALSNHDLVLGPARDGGYYLIGLGRRAPRLFDDIDWGTKNVLAQTLERARGLRYFLLDELSDVDRPEDVGYWQEVEDRCYNCQSPGLSVIIPTLNEAADIAETIAQVRRADEVEVIVADGRSTDATVEIARAHGARVVIADPGRGGQMNAGAEAARGEYLLFLHADTRPPMGYDMYIRAALESDNVAVGAFELGIEAPGRALRVIEWGANLRSRRAKMPYGDQAIFTRQEIFSRVGGFPDLPLMEDVELVRRLKKVGRLVIVPRKVSTSARRWQSMGVIKTWIVNQLAMAAMYVGVSPEAIAGWYYRDRQC